MNGSLFTLDRRNIWQERCSLLDVLPSAVGISCLQVGSRAALRQGRYFHLLPVTDRIGAKFLAVHVNAWHLALRQRQRAISHLFATPLLESKNASVKIDHWDMISHLPESGHHILKWFVNHLKLLSLTKVKQC